MQALPRFYQIYLRFCGGLL